MTDENDAAIIAFLQEPLLSQSPNGGDVGTSENSTADVLTSNELQNLPHRIVDGLLWERAILIKSLYFLDALGSSTWGRFSAIYYNIHGLNSQQIGCIEGLRTALPTLSMLVWGIVSDRFCCRKRVWVVTKSASTCILLFLALPYVFQSFRRILVVSILAQLFVSSGILDAYTLELLGNQNKMFYGRYRLYASLSWGLGSIVMGWVTDHYGFEFNFIMFGVLSAMMIALVVTKIPDTSAQYEDNNDEMNESSDDNIHHQPQQQGGTSGKIMDLIWLALRPRVTVFLIEVLVMGAAMATVERLLFLYMVNDLDASTLLCGLSVGVNVFFELPIFWYASSIMKFLGRDVMFLLSMACFVVRVYGYTWLTPETKWLILFLESMHGVTFATFWIVTTDVSKVLIETEGNFWSTAIPMSIQMLYSAVGVSVGSVLGGWAMHKYGSRQMYTFTASGVLCMLMLHIFGSIFARSFGNVGSFLPDVPHSSDQAEGSDAVRFNDEINGEEICYSDGDGEMENGQDDNAQSQHLTCTDIIQIGSLVERQDRPSRRGRLESNSHRQGHLALLVACIVAQLAPEVSSYSIPAGKCVCGGRLREGLFVHRKQSNVDIESVNGAPLESKKKRKSTATTVRNANEERWHWMDASDPVTIETVPSANTNVSSTVIKLGFTVRGNPRPLRRHRTSRGHVYNPSLKYQKSFRDVVEQVIIRNLSIEQDGKNEERVANKTPIFAAEEQLIMTLVFRMKRPKSHFVNGKPGPDRLKTTAPSQTSAIRTDVDNLTKFVLDSMNQVLYDDDRQIMSIHVTKLLDNDGMCEGSTELFVRSIVDSDVERILEDSIALTCL
ncbi:major facilitator superfamily MFS_1 protein [Nitzschia inconspicua]|uniref:Major facilitator superfamily MFS_1 protein n=1 Tax=Nitzschia inconspicua TaxID=303405 RepID=A0A9K3PIT2_9STRA|nr:major facilitator superfamily MFS_1 protein [Nitzschia inconspicua]KAG7348281.1 major facilitator superfamily MFS_1 protein [Nitzschia inconspicua]